MRVGEVVLGGLGAARLGWLDGFGVGVALGTRRRRGAIAWLGRWCWGGVCGGEFVGVLGWCCAGMPAIRAGGFGVLWQECGLSGISGWRNVEAGMPNPPAADFQPTLTPLVWGVAGRVGNAGQRAHRRWGAIAWHREVGLGGVCGGGLMESGLVLRRMPNSFGLDALADGVCRLLEAAAGGRGGISGGDDVDPGGFRRRAFQWSASKMPRIVAKLRREVSMRGIRRSARGWW